MSKDSRISYIGTNLYLGRSKDTSVGQSFNLFDSIILGAIGNEYVQ